MPAFVGLGAPYWDAEARGTLIGLTRGTGRAEIARAALESVGYQTRDLYDAMRADWPATPGETVLRVDGGMVASDWTMQFLADMLDAPVDRPVIARDDGAGRGLSRRLCGGRLPGAGGVRPGLEARPAFRAAGRWTEGGRKNSPDGATRSPAHAPVVA